MGFQSGSQAVGCSVEICGGHLVCCVGFSLCLGGRCVAKWLVELYGGHGEEEAVGG